jgi:hypothetical protein
MLDVLVPTPNKLTDALGNFSRMCVSGARICHPHPQPSAQVSVGSTGLPSR